MYDRRVIRGNTFSRHFWPSNVKDRSDDVSAHTKAKKDSRRLRKPTEVKPLDPLPVEGRQHAEVQSELYLEELSDKVEETETDCQTDPFLDRPPSPLFIPSKSGLDKATEILPDDLFFFDVEVRPILEILVGKTIEQALIEVLEEEELAAIRDQQRQFEELRQADLAEQHRLEERERRMREEKERRKKQHLEISERQKELAEKLAARAFSKMYMEPLVPTVFDHLYENGYFYDVVERDVEVNFLPWLVDAVGDELDFEINVRGLLDMMIREVVTENHQTYAALDAAAIAVMLSAEQQAMLNQLHPTVGSSTAQADEIRATTKPSPTSQDGTADSSGLVGGRAETNLPEKTKEDTALEIIEETSENGEEQKIEENVEDEAEERLSDEG
ncbi:Radial spoke head protein 3 [Sparganum proliferum]